MEQKRTALLAFILTCGLAACSRSQHGASPDDSASHRGRIHLAYGMTTMRQMDYAVDGHLNLELTRTIRLELAPQVLGTHGATPYDRDETCEIEPDNACGRDTLMPLRSGHYLVRYALVHNTHTNEPNAYQLMAAGEVLAQAASGNMVVDLPLRMRTLQALSARNQLLIEISAADERLLRADGTGVRVVPKDGLSLADVEDKRVALRHVVYETALDPTATPRLIFAPFDISALEGPLKLQMESYRPWLNDETGGPATMALAKDPVRLHRLRDVIAVREALDGLEAAKARAQSSRYAESQDLVDLNADVDKVGSVSRQALLEAMEKREVSTSLNENLCELFRSKLLPDLVRENLHREPEEPWLLNPACQWGRSQGLTQFKVVRMLGFKYAPFFLFQNVYMVDSARMRKMESPGRLLNVQVGDRFYLRTRTEWEVGIGARPLAWLKSKWENLGVLFDASIDRSLKTDSSNDIHFMTNMQLDVEENTLALDFTRYRRCLIVRLNPAVIASNGSIKRLMNVAENEEERELLSGAFKKRGLMVCGGMEEKRVTKSERYYFITTGKEITYQQDAGDLRNRQISLPLRGRRDFLAFVQAGKGTMERPDTTDPDFIGIDSWLDSLEDGLFSVTSAASGVYLDSLFY